MQHSDQAGTERSTIDDACLRRHSLHLCLIVGGDHQWGRTWQTLQKDLKKGVIPQVVFAVIPTKQ
jgi:hypothetical protein